MNRLASSLFCAAVLLIACASQPKTTMAHPETVRRVAVLERELVWLGDTIPLLRIEPFPIYALWRHEIETCVGRTKQGWPRLFISALHTLPSDMAAFYTNKPPTIVFALGYEVSASTFRHELLHWLLDPDRSHDSEPWRKCFALLQSEG